MFVQQPWDFEERLNIIFEAKVLNVELRPKLSKAPQVALQSGKLEIEGNLEVASWVDSQRQQIKHKTLNTYLPAFPAALNDTTDQMQGDDTAWCIKIAETSPGRPLSLMLVQIEPDIYRRVGTFGNMDSREVGPYPQGLLSYVPEVGLSRNPERWFEEGYECCISII